jgi:5'-nucleotidase
VNVALSHLLQKDLPDAVVSGINFGYNCAMPLLLSSGTVAAAIEGAHWGLPAAALSLELANQDYLRLQNKQPLPSSTLEKAQLAAQHASEQLPDILKHGQPSCTVHNFNYPASLHARTAQVLTRPWTPPAHGLYEPVSQSNDSFQFRYPDTVPKPEAGTDVGALLEQKISHSVLDFGSAENKPPESPQAPH